MKGHQLIAYLAQQQLEPQSQQRIEQILDGKSLVVLASWADYARKQEAWKHTGPWHYINIPKGQSLEQSQRNPKGDVLSQLEYFEQQLKQAHLSKLERQQALKFYIHFVGDIHQPLHVGYAKDRGGNKVKVNWYGKTTNLHRVWDSQLLDNSKLSLGEYAQYLQASYPNNDQINSYQEWLNQSRALLPAVYQLADKNLSDDYATQHRPTLELQIVRAGQRLAKKLNQIFGSNP
ncbi:S1/P1 nuclease [Agarivorans aestuarii]|uniref:S1/P1 nuclease n=1 Tax=Agarivorans aestuarii TaxID=1563703 RepID=A0ABU7G505_9ALTE|nr:S1/P1 nuclease [Agarivorans aestuarii]MEE1674321.1 S1/P1 nuclease [Agarivorans aestuarii]